MPSVTLYADKDARIAQSGSTNLGAGASKRSPYGLYSGYKYRTLIDFPALPAGITSITKATLYTRTSDEYYVAFGSTPRCYIERITESWSEGSSDSMSTGNAVTWANQPNVTTTNRVMYTPTATQNAWDSALITLLMRDVLAAGSFYGLRLGNYNETSGSNVGEIWTTEQGTSYRPYIVVEYETNTAPNAPTLTSPGNGSKVTDATPALAFTASDPDAGDTLSKYHIQVSTNSGFSALVWDSDNQTSGISGMTVSRAYAGTALARGTTYYWRAATYDADGVKGPFSAYRTFKYNSLPTVARKFTADWAAGPSNLNSTTESIASALKIPLTFTPTDPDGDSITGYELEIGGGLSVTYTVTGTFTSGTAITYTPAANFVNGTAYTYRVRAKDSEGVYGSWSALSQFRPRMSQVIYQFNVGAGNKPTVKTGTKTAALQLLYRLAAVNAGSPDAWKTTPPTPTAAKPYLNVMVRMSVISDISGEVDQPTLSSLTVTWSSTDTTPYNWAGFTATNDDGSKVWELDRSGNANRYGINSVQGAVSTASGNRSIYQDISGLQPNTEYSYGAWVKVGVLQSFTSGTPYVSVRIFPYGLGTGQISVSNDLINSASPFVGDGQWHRLVGRFTTGEYTGVRLYLHIQQSNGIVAELNWDAVMLSEGPVLPSWTPALQGTPVIIDANGIYVDNEAGGIFRQTNAGISGARGLVELTATGIRIEQSEIAVVGAGTTAFAADTDATRTGQYQFLLGKDGKLNWGPGAGAARDVNLYRGAANLLKTDDDFEAANLIVPLSGTFTPTFTGLGTGTVSSAVCDWVRIGRMITFRLSWTMATAGTGSTTVAVATGLPNSVAGARFAGDRGGSAVEGVLARFQNSGGYFAVNSIVAFSAPTTFLTGSTMVLNQNFAFQGSYIVSASAELLDEMLDVPALNPQ